MRTKKATTAMILDKRYSLKSDKSNDNKEEKEEDKIYPIKLRVTYDRKPRLFGVNISISEKDWDKLHSDRLKDENLKVIRKEISKIEENAENIIKKLNYFTFDGFTKVFNSEQGDSDDVYKAIERYIKVCDSEDRISTSNLYGCTLSSLKRFKSSLKFQEVTVSWLKTYETWMRKHGNSNTNGPASNTTIGMYMRCLNTMVSQAVEEGVLSYEQYPFGKRKYTIPGSVNVKKALELKELEKIFKHEFTAKQVNQERSRDFWVFSYLANGMNMKDVCRLKWKDFHGDKFVFIRAKTERTCRVNPKNITVIVVDHLKYIIEKWGNTDKSPENYVFPFLTDDMDAKTKHKKVKSMIGMVNRHMKALFKKLGINKKHTTYAARHSYSTVVKRKGGTTEFIQEALGHTTKTTTENYLDEFEDKVKRQYASVLTEF